MYTRELYDTSLSITTTIYVYDLRRAVKDCRILTSLDTHLNKSELYICKAPLKAPSKAYPCEEEHTMYIDRHGPTHVPRTLAPV